MKYKHRYTPPAKIAVEPTRRDEFQDCYTGAREALVAAGVAPAHLFPGEPGMPAGCVVLWPTDAPPGSDWRLPGRLSINKLPSGKFTASLSVSADEQRVRRDQKEARRDALRQQCEEEQRLVLAERAAGTSLEEIIKTLGEPAVRRRLRELSGTASGRARAGHLRLVWSAPELSGGHLGRKGGAA